MPLTAVSQKCMRASRERGGGGKEMVEEGEYRRHQPAGHHRVRVDRHLRVVVGDRHMQAERHAAQC